MTDPRTIVHTNLDSAIENDYTEILTWPVDDIVCDLRAYASDCEAIDPAVLREHVESWLLVKKENQHGK
jgi:hypothetical protein